MGRARAVVPVAFGSAWVEQSTAGIHSTGGMGHGMVEYDSKAEAVAVEALDSHCCYANDEGEVLEVLEVQEGPYYAMMVAEGADLAEEMEDHLGHPMMPTMQAEGVVRTIGLEEIVEGVAVGQEGLKETLVALLQLPPLHRRHQLHHSACSSCTFGKGMRWT